MNYTLKDHLQRVNELIEKHGEDAHCGAWIFTAENCIVYHEDTKEYHFVAEDNPYLAKRILTNVADDDHIFQVIQECVDEITEEQYMLYQQELEDESPLVEWTQPQQHIPSAWQLLMAQRHLLRQCPHAQRHRKVSNHRIISYQNG